MKRGSKMEKETAKHILKALRTQAELLRKDSRKEMAKYRDGAGEYFQGTANGLNDAVISLEKHMLLILDQSNIDLSELDHCCM